ncbi:group III truncated hemoglobin [Pontibacter beigongshangensis]|uniref:group III truncated hemoglobin n=1 Tax=Pontibacter beigongshangensis TaxID=2574733 RepID=UPI001650802E|nr:group III truncated hemoglobin [Pontibacter beigongshangensis]
MRDIEKEEDIRILVDSFYGQVNRDELLSPVFNEFAQVDWEAHLPVMYSFWSTVLFGSMAYKGQPFPKHLRLPIDEQHFDRWVTLFTATVDALFKGEKAEDIKFKAQNIARIFQMKMGILAV